MAGDLFYYILYYYWNTLPLEHFTVRIFYCWNILLLEYFTIGLFLYYSRFFCCIDVSAVGNVLGYPIVLASPNLGLRHKIR